MLTPVLTEGGNDLFFYELLFFLNSLKILGLEYCHLLINESGKFFPVLSFYLFFITTTAPVGLVPALKTLLQLKGR